MTTFSQVFKALFKDKSKSTYIVFGTQLIAALIILVISFFDHSVAFYQKPEIAGAHLPIWVGVVEMYVVYFALLAGITDLAYLLMTSWKNEKINRSQSFRLMPISDSKFYLANTLSSFAAFIYLVVLKLLVYLIGALIIYMSSGQLRANLAAMLKAVQNSSLDFNWLIIPGAVLIALLIVIFWYIVVSFYHFISRIVIDFLPAARMGLYRIAVWAVRLVMLIAVVYVVVWVGEAASALSHPLSALFGQSDIGSLGVVILILALFDLIFGSINILLFNQFIEAKQ